MTRGRARRRRRYLLLSHAFSHSNATCASLYAKIRPFASHGINEHLHVAGGSVRDPDRVVSRAHFSSGSVNDDATRAKVHDNATLRATFDRYSGLDRALYDAGVVLFCDEFRRARRAPPGASCVPSFAAADPAACDGVTATDLHRLARTYPPFPRAGARA